MAALAALPVAAQVCAGAPRTDEERFVVVAEARARGFDTQSVGPAASVRLGEVDVGLRYGATHSSGLSALGHSAEGRVTWALPMDDTRLCFSVGLNYNWSEELGYRDTRKNLLVSVATLELLGVGVSFKSEGTGVYPYAYAGAIRIFDQSVLYNRSTIEPTGASWFDAQVEAGVSARASWAVFRVGVRVPALIRGLLLIADYGDPPLTSLSPMAIVSVGGAF